MRTEDGRAEAHEAEEDPEAGPRIVVGIDGSSPSSAALGWAARQAEMTGCPLEVVLAWEWPVSFGWVPVIPSGYDPADEAEKVLENAIAKARTDHPGVEFRPLVVEGHPAPVLVRRSRGADLLVVGSRGHGEFMEMLLGSVGGHCVANAHCPVLVFREGV